LGEKSDAHYEKDQGEGAQSTRKGFEEEPFSSASTEGWARTIKRREKYEESQ